MFGVISIDCPGNSNDCESDWGRREGYVGANEKKIGMVKYSQRIENTILRSLNTIR